MLNIGHFGAALPIAVVISIGGVLFPPAFIALIFPLDWIVWRYLVVRTQTFELTNERLLVSKGVINQEIDTPLLPFPNRLPSVFTALGGKANS